MTLNYTLIPYRESNHGSFDDEWAPHKNSSGWWYITGYFSDKNNSNSLYSFQYTVVQGRIYGITAYILHMGLTDFQKNSHLFKQKVQLRKKGNIGATHDKVVFAPYTSLTRDQQNLTLEVTTDEFDLNLTRRKE